MNDAAVVDWNLSPPVAPALTVAPAPAPAPALVIPTYGKSGYAYGPSPVLEPAPLPFAPAPAPLAFATVSIPASVSTAPPTPVIVTPPAIDASAVDWRMGPYPPPYVPPEIGPAIPPNRLIYDASAGGWTAIAPPPSPPPPPPPPPLPSPLDDAVTQVLSLWGTTNSRGSHQRVIRENSDRADSVPVDAINTLDRTLRLRYALQILEAGNEARASFSKKGYQAWVAAIGPLRALSSEAEKAAPEWVPQPLNYYDWIRVAPQLGFTGPLYENEGYSPQLAAFVDRARAAGYDFVEKASNYAYYNNWFGFRLPSGEVVGQTRTGDDDSLIDFLKVAAIPVLTLTGGFAFAGAQVAALTGAPALVGEIAAKVALTEAIGGSGERALISSLAPVAIQALPGPDLFPTLPSIDPTLLEVTPEVLPVFDFVGPVLPPALLEVTPEPPPVYEPEPLPVYEPPPPVYEPPPLPVFEPPAPPVYEPPPLPWSIYQPPPVPVFEPEPLPVFEPEPLTFLEPEPVQFEPVPVVELPAIETMAPIPTIDTAPPTIEPVEVFTQPVEVPKMDDEFFWRGVEVEAPAFDVDFSDPFAGIEIPEFDVSIPEYGDDIYTTAWDADPIYGPPIPGETYPPAYDVVTVDDAAQLPADILVGGSGGGVVEVGGNFAPNPDPGNPGLSVGQVLRDANGIMLEALKLVDSYRRLVNPQPPNRVTQARVGSSTVRATPDGMIVTTDASGRTVRTKPPVGQPQMTTDGSMIVNNGDGTYTSISPSGAMATNRYPTTGAAASHPYTTPLLIGGAILALVALTR